MMPVSIMLQGVYSSKFRFIRVWQALPGSHSPSLGFLVMSWITCHFACNCKEASSHLTLLGSTAKTFVLKRFCETERVKLRLKRNVLFSSAGDRPVACSIQLSMTSWLTEGKWELCCVRHYYIKAHTLLWDICSLWTFFGQMQGYDQVFDTIQPLHSVDRG